MGGAPLAAETGERGPEGAVRMMAVHPPSLRGEALERRHGERGAAARRVAVRGQMVAMTMVPAGVPVVLVMGVAVQVDARRGERDGDGADPYEQRQSTHE
jgi:hypothetical protein